MTAPGDGPPVRRRDCLRASAALLMLGTGGGCLGDGDGRSVPLRVVNRSGERRRPAVSVTERGSGEAVFSRTVALGPGDDREFTVGPIDPERRDTVAHELGDQTGAESVAGDDLRAVEMAVGEDGRVGTILSVSDADGGA